MMIQEINRKNYQRLIKIKTTDQKKKKFGNSKKKKRGRMIKLVVDDEKINCVKK